MTVQEMVTAELMRFSSQVALSDSVMASIEVEQYHDIALRQLVHSITIGLLGKETSTEEFDDVVKTYPATIWEELKSLWPGWLRRRFPVQYTREIRHRTVKHYHVCPHVDYPRGDASHIQWLRGEQEV
ncbi:hypothetical protein LCGC14_2743160 [marine sediment metagenome]|uniref:Uncharacterized protein n=1 Tax=marine sediment metagenome TaxID=412755 RepID=A0A0F8ZR35_9ZZZZ